MKTISTVVAILSALTACAPRAGFAQQADDMAELSLEQLSNIVITSVSRQPARLSAAPASLYIISASDIRRSGARTLPEALRLAPNLQVARADARNYAISARGFNSVFANKLLVLIDGRSVYSPLFSGVFWDAQEVVLADVARIEVISGPGATIWGANAVNGVINVITKNAADTQGNLLSAGGGEHEGNGVLRHGGKLAGGGHYRVYGSLSEADDTATAAGASTLTGWHRRQTGFRADLPVGTASLAVSGDAYEGKLAQAQTVPIAIAGANLTARYTALLPDNQVVNVQIIADHTQRDQPNAFNEHLDTLALEVQHDIRRGAHNIIWGGGYRYSWDRIVNSLRSGFLPASLDMHWGNVFIQDEIALTEPLRLTAGVKFEQNNYTGMEVLPNLRLAYTHGDHLFWSSLSRTVRAPSRIDRDFYSPTYPPVTNGVPRYTIGGGPDFESETAKVAELGYRGQPLPTLSWSATVFFSDFERLRTLEVHTGSPWTFENLRQGRARGIEMWARWQVLPAWRLDGGAVLQKVRTSLLPGSRDVSELFGLTPNDPDRRYTLRSSHDLGQHHQLDLNLRYVGSLPRPAVPAYYELDVMWMWTPTPKVDIGISGLNLLHRNHVEFGAAPGRSVIERAVQLSAAYRF